MDGMNERTRFLWLVLAVPVLLCSAAALLFCFFLFFLFLRVLFCLDFSTWTCGTLFSYSLPYFLSLRELLFGGGL